MPDFTFYTAIYGGGLLPGADIFEGLYPRAEAQLLKLERGYTVCYPTPDSRDKALCALADEVYLTCCARDTAEGLVTRVSAGSVSTSYASLSPESMLLNAEKRYYRALQVYADIYRGTGKHRMETTV